MFSVTSQGHSRDIKIWHFRPDHCWSLVLMRLCLYLEFYWLSLHSVIAPFGEGVNRLVSLTLLSTLLREHVLSTACFFSAALSCQPPNAWSHLPWSLPLFPPRAFQYHLSLCLMKCLNHLKELHILRMWPQPYPSPSCFVAHRDQC